MRKTKVKLHTTVCGGNRYAACCFFISEEELNEWLREIYFAETLYIDRQFGLAIATWLE